MRKAPEGASLPLGGCGYRRAALMIALPLSALVNLHACDSVPHRTSQSSITVGQRDADPELQRGTQGK